MEEVFLNLEPKGKERVKITDSEDRRSRPNVYNRSSIRKKRNRLKRGNNLKKRKSLELKDMTLASKGMLCP